MGPGLRLLARPEVLGLENVPESGAAILASNHLSLLDSVSLPLMLNRPITFAAKSEYFTGTRPVERIAGAYLRATKQLSVDRTGTRAAQEMLEAALGRPVPGSGARSPTRSSRRSRNCPARSSCRCTRRCARSNWRPGHRTRRASDLGTWDLGTRDLGTRDLDRLVDRRSRQRQRS